MLRAKTFCFVPCALFFQGRMVCFSCRLLWFSLQEPIKSHKSWCPASREYYIFSNSFQITVNGKEQNGQSFVVVAFRRLFVHFISWFSSNVLQDSTASIESLHFLTAKRFPWVFSLLTLFADHPAALLIPELSDYDNLAQNSRNWENRYFATYS